MEDYCSDEGLDKLLEDHRKILQKELDLKEIENKYPG